MVVVKSYRLSILSKLICSLARGILCKLMKKVSMVKSIAVVKYVRTVKGEFLMENRNGLYLCGSRLVCWRMVLSL